MRILIAAVLGAIVLFGWGFVSHMLLPIGEMGIQQPQNEDVVLEGVRSGLPAPGIYMLPSIDKNGWNDEPTMKAWAEKAKANPFAYVVVAPSPTDPAGMGPQLAKQFGSDFLASALVAWLLAATTWGFGMRVLGAAGIGVFGWLACIVPMWNWYRFPTDYMVGGFIEQGAGWLLGGVAIAWWLGRK
ncbi:MAG TPA: hypothetical protein PKC03_13210 [Dokdonella sp.]|jgi:hypothetical protein|nr:hypothetical protein [Dokdonella sp.]